MFEPGLGQIGVQTTHSESFSTLVQATPAMATSAPPPAPPAKRVRQLKHVTSGGTSAIVAYRAAIIHSTSMTTLDMLPDALLVVDHAQGGIILDLIDVEHQEEEKIAEIALAATAEELVYLTDRILMPGFVDTHAHAPQYAFTGTGMHLPLLKW